MNDFEDSYRELAKSYGVPLIPPNRSEGALRLDPDKPIAVCGQCGTTIYRVMAYSCPHKDCPCGLGPTGSLCLNTNELSGSLK